MAYNDLELGAPANSSNDVSDSSNGVASACKATSVISFILAFIGGIIIGQATADIYSDFNLQTAFYIWVGSFLFCLILFAIGEIINQLAISNDNTKRIIQALAKNEQSVHSNINNNSFDDLPNL